LEDGNDKKRILLVEDEVDIATLLKEGLERTGDFYVDSYNDPLLALRNFKSGSSSYDLVLVDIKMPIMDGVGLYERVRKIDNKIRVCFLTASEMSSQKIRTLSPDQDAGCSVIMKPIGVRELANKLKIEISR
jgi:DNA-binding response OmpR family regulator